MVETFCDWPAERIEAALRLMRQPGAVPAKIAETIGCKRSQIYQLGRKFGITFATACKGKPKPGRCKPLGAAIDEPSFYCRRLMGQAQVARLYGNRSYV